MDYCTPSSEELLERDSDVGAFALHLQQLYLYYKARRMRGQAVLVVAVAWACYNVSVWLRGWNGWKDSGGPSWFLVLNTLASVSLASLCAQSTYRDSHLYVPHRYEDRSNGILALLGLRFEGRSKNGDALQRTDGLSSKGTRDGVRRGGRRQGEGKRRR